MDANTTPAAETLTPDALYELSYDTGYTAAVAAYGMTSDQRELAFDHGRKSAADAEAFEDGFYAAVESQMDLGS